METPGQTAARLLAALEELTGQEDMHLRGGDYDLAGESRRRAEPLVQQLVALAGRPGVAALRPRVDALLGRSARHAAFLQARLAELAAEIRRTDQARYRVAQLAPAYARPSGTPRFQAAG